MPVQPDTPKINPNKAAFLELAEAHADLFNLQNAKPLAVGIHHELAAAGILSKTKIRRGLGFYVRQRAYLKAVAAGGTRHGLQGPSGEVSEQEAEHAKQQLAELEQRLKERRAAYHKAKRTESKKKVKAEHAAQPAKTAEKPVPMQAQPKAKSTRKQTLTEDPSVRLSNKLAQLTERFGKDKQD